MIPRIDAKVLAAGAPEAVEVTRVGAHEIGFLTAHNTGLSPAEVTEALEAHRSFFKLPETEKRAIDMARTASNRGWGADGSEQVDPDAYPDDEQVFGCGYELPEVHDLVSEQLTKRFKETYLHLKEDS